MWMKMKKGLLHDSHLMDYSKVEPMAERDKQQRVGQEKIPTA
jgi:hypothetical protein